MSDVSQSLLEEMKRSIDQTDQAIERVKELRTNLKTSKKKWSELMALRNEIMDLNR